MPYWLGPQVCPTCYVAEWPEVHAKRKKKNVAGCIQTDLPPVPLLTGTSI